MPNQHKHSPLRFRPPAAEREWLLARAAGTGEPMNAILTLAVRALMAAADADPFEKFGFGRNAAQPCEPGEDGAPRG